jgi:hypothetical protein
MPIYSVINSGDFTFVSSIIATSMILIRDKWHINGLILDATFAIK